LERLSERYGVLIQSIGGVSILNDEELERLCRVFYVDDPGSGDLLFRVGYWEEIPWWSTSGLILAIMKNPSFI